MNKRLKYFIHFAFWVYMFLSPLQFMRGTDVSFQKYLMECMAPMLLMLVFYANFFWLTPKYFVAGKHRYYLLINLVLVLTLGYFMHIWIEYAHELFPDDRPKHPREFDNLDFWLFTLRDIISLSIVVLSATCIVLAQRWNWAQQAISRAEAARADAELSNMRNQINPHFLLNTLNNIYALTAFDTQKAQTAIQELSKMMRHILYDYQEPTVPLHEEVEFLENYVELMKIRLPQSVEVSFTTDIQNDLFPVAPMIFISLIENAFKHGVSATEPSYIHIIIEADQRQIVCNIENSNHPKSGNDHSGHGIGLKQVERRLELAYYEQYTWEKGVSADGKVYHSRICIAPVNLQLPTTRHQSIDQQLPTIHHQPNTTKQTL